MNGNLNIAVIENNIVWADKAANLSKLEQHLKQIPDDIDLVVLPEMFTTGFITDRDLADNLAERNTEGSISEIHRLARAKRTAIAGSFLARTAGKLYNRAFFIEPSGDETFYDKRHLFRMGGEREVFSEGTTLAPTIRYRGWNIKIVICYDLRFPAWCRCSEHDNYDLLIAVANWPSSRIDAWGTLLAARAIENECYVCGVNRTGRDASGVDYGEKSSGFIDFKGKPIVSKIVQDESDRIIITSLDYAKLQNFREKFPAWKDADAFDIDL